MNDSEVRIVRLEPMRVAWVRSVGESPERAAWEKLQKWASPKGLLNDPQGHPVFGFNNPSPSPKCKDYGYEFWVVVDPGVTGEGEIGIRDVEGGLYAVVSCRLQGDPAGTVQEVWRKLWNWAQSDGRHRWRKTHELERCVNPGAPDRDLILDLYLPIEERPAPLQAR